MKRSLKKACLQRLHDTFGVSGFRPGQFEAVRALLSCRDVMCILPTGAGKSLCWQLPSVMHPGLTVVVSPLIALMRDQVQRLQEMGIPALSLDSLMDIQERENAMKLLRQGAARIVFVSPERLMQDSFRRLCHDSPPWLVVVDEAHCVVQWGEGFRPAYAEIGKFLRKLPRRPALCALTATADDAIQREIRDSLGMCRPKKILLPVVRENLRYEVRTTLDGTADILRLLHTNPCRTVIFCRTRIRTERLSDLIAESGVKACHYHAGMTREERMRVQQSFADGDVQVLCATTAFGMGVDIPDIRRIIHDEMPDSIIDYVQQSGRAGRDGVDAECILFVEPRHLVRRANLWKRLADKTKFQPIRRWLKYQKHRRTCKQLLDVLLVSDCIVSGISRAFGQKARLCGRCSACRRGPLLTHAPDLGAMKDDQVRLFLLRWQRDALAKKRSCQPAQVMPDAVLNIAAQKLAFPEDAPAPPELQRLLVHFVMKEKNDSGP